MALATALGALGTAYFRTGANRTGIILTEAGAGIARDHDFPFPLTRALANLGAFMNSRDLGASLRYTEEARDVARRAGLKPWVENAVLNRAVALWFSGRLTEVAELVPEGLAEGTDARSRIPWGTFAVWIAEAQGQPLPEPIADLDTDTDAQADLAWLGSADLCRAVTAGDHSEAARMAPLVLEHLLASAGLDDDFFLLWPQLVLAGLGAGNLELAEQLMAPVATALPGNRPVAVDAQWHRLSGLLAAARGDDPDHAETELRAGVLALAAFGAVGFHAQAQEELGRWLVDQGRDEEAAPLLDAARTTYADIGAAGWLTRLDSWDDLRRARDTASSSTPA
jgi:hypothetical protein